jgi:hypothetical protein
MELEEALLDASVSGRSDESALALIALPDRAPDGVGDVS